MENMEQYIGRKIKGFKFEKTDLHHYSVFMNDCIGQIGVITNFTGNSFCVRFGKNKSWYYPCELAIKHLVPIEIKTITKEEATALIESVTGDKYEIL